jgi:hypothetical protein
MYVIRNVLLLLLFLLLGTGLFAQVSVGGYNLNTENRIMFTAQNVKVEGMNGKPLRFLLTVFKEDREGMPSHFFDITPESSDEEYYSVTLELSYEEIYNYTGPGDHSVYIVFYVFYMEDSDYVILQDSYITLTEQMEFSPGEFSDTKDEDIAFNTSLIREKAETDPLYRELLTFMEKYELFVCIRDFSFVSRGTLENYSYGFCTEKDDLNLRRYLRYLIDSFGQLPVEFVQETKLKGFVYVKDIIYAGVDVGAGYDVPYGYIINEVNNFFQEEQILNAYYHEYMHYIEAIFPDRFDNETWNSFNPGDFNYSFGGALEMISLNSTFVNKDHPSPGFLNGYCTADIYQDKAEVFSYLFVPSLYKKSSPWPEYDTYLKGKFDYMKNVLQSMSADFNFKLN